MAFEDQLRQTKGEERGEEKNEKENIGERERGNEGRRR